MHKTCLGATILLVYVRTKKRIWPLHFPGEGKCFVCFKVFFLPERTQKQTKHQTKSVSVILSYFVAILFADSI